MNFPQFGGQGNAPYPDSQATRAYLTLESVTKSAHTNWVEARPKPI